MNTGTDDLLARVERGVGVVTLNRPDRRNALSRPMLDALAEVLTAFAADDTVRALLLTGAGKAFCAGGDVKAFAERGGAAGGEETFEDKVARQLASQRATTGALHTFPKPTVAALPGAAAGAGIGLALACDLRVGTPTTVFATAFAKVGLSGDYGTTWLLSQIAGPARARRALLLGERIDADTALEWGVLDQVAEDATTHAFEIAAGLAAGPRQAYASMKQNLLDAGTCSLDEAMAREVPRHLTCGQTDDHHEAVRAFVERRPASFT